MRQNPGRHGKIYGGNPQAPSALLKSRLHTLMAEHFEPVIFAGNPFFFEMGLREANSWGLSEICPAGYARAMREEALHREHPLLYRLEALADRLYDYKLTGEEAHRLHTGAGQRQILENLHLLDESGAGIILRCPMIPGVNIYPEHEAGIIGVAGSLRHLKQIHLETYHNIGLSKRTRLGMDTSGDIVPPDGEMLREMARRITEATGCETLVM